MWSGARDIFLDFRAPFSGAGIFLFPGCRTQAPRGPGAGLSSGALRAPELKTASGMPARFARRLRRKIFYIFVSMFLCFGSQILVIFLQIFAILGSEFSYSAFSYRVSEVYKWPVY